MQHSRTVAERVAGDRLQALCTLLGLSDAQVRGFPGALAYCQFLEDCFGPLLNNEYAVIWTVIGRQRPHVPEGCWPWFITVAATIRGSKKIESSIEDIWESLLKCTSTSVTCVQRPDDEAKTACLIGVFSVLCWATMTLQPKLTWPDIVQSASLMVEQGSPDQPGLKMDLVRRPIPVIFRSLQRVMPTSRWRQPIRDVSNESSTALYVSSLNYASLKLMSKIHLVWVNDLSSHLDFDSANRRLSIFRFPSFCALNALEETSRTAVFDGYVTTYSLCQVMSCMLTFPQSSQSALWH